MMSFNEGSLLKEKHLKYIKEILVAEILVKLQDEKLEDLKIDFSGGLDGFMSALYNIELKTSKSNGSKRIKERLLIAKFMKGDENFRQSSKSYIQFANEIFVYAKVFPAFEELLRQAHMDSVSTETWVSHCYVAKFGYVEGLSANKSTRECVLVLEHLKPRGYTLGPRLYLNRDHLLAMTKPLAEYHALSNVLRAHNENDFENLRKQIVPLPFIYPNDPEAEKNNLYRVLYRVAFDRFYDYFDRMVAQNTFNKETPEDLKLIENLRRIREKYFDNPTKLLEHLRTNIDNNEEDKRFGVILHGDYNRNNVLFRYEAEGGVSDDARKVADAKLIDFQELRFGTPAIDLSFLMYFNTPGEIRNEVWPEILKTYHARMYNTFEKTLRGLKGASIMEEVPKLLAQYSFEHFSAHFSRYAFYGVLICFQFLPFYFASEKECVQLSHLFETDMQGEEFYKLSMIAGGDEANKRILEVVKHASRMGYMDSL